MICPSKPTAASSLEHLVVETLEGIAAKAITVELVFNINGRINNGYNG